MNKFLELAIREFQAGRPVNLDELCCHNCVSFEQHDHYCSLHREEVAPVGVCRKFESDRDIKESDIIIWQF